MVSPRAAAGAPPAACWRRHGPPRRGDRSDRGRERGGGNSGLPTSKTNTLLGASAINITFDVGSANLLQSEQGASGGTATLTLNADGSYAQTFAGAPGEPAPPAASGAWTAQTLGETRFSLTLVRTGEPAANARPLTFRVVDDDTLLNETENYRARRVK